MLNIISSYGWYEKSLRRSHNYQPVHFLSYMKILFKTTKFLKFPTLMHSVYYLPALWDANLRTLALELFVRALIWRHTRTTQFIRTVVAIVNSVTLVRFVNTLLQIGTFELGPRTGNGWAIFFVAVVKTIVVSIAFPTLRDTVSWVMTSELEIKINKKLNLWSENVNILRQQNDKGLKVAFFRKCDSFFKSPNFLKKNIPKNYPELEI